MRTNSRVQSFPSPEPDLSSPPLSNQFDQSFAPQLSNLQKLQRHRISFNGLSKTLDGSVIAQKMGMKMAIEAIDPTTCNSSDWKFINSYLDSTVLLLDACNNIQLRFESIKSCLDSIPIALHYLEGEHEPSMLVLQRAIVALDSSRFRDKRHYNKMDKSMSRMRTVGKKLSGQAQLTNQNAIDGVSPKLYKALSGSWAMAVFAVGVLNSATSFRSLTSQGIHPPKAEPWKTLLNEVSNKIKVFPKKANENASMEELASVDLASQSLLKLISTWQKDGNCGLRRMTVKAVAGELKRRKEELEKTIPLLEEKIAELYKQIIAFRINLFGLLSKAQKKEVFEMVKHSCYEDSQMDVNVTPYQRGTVCVELKTKKIRRSCSMGRIGRHCIGFTKNTGVKQSSLNI